MGIRSEPTFGRGDVTENPLRTFSFEKALEDNRRLEEIPDNESDREGEALREIHAVPLERVGIGAPPPVRGPLLSRLLYEHIILRPEEIFGTIRDPTFTVDRDGRFQREDARLVGHPIQRRSVGDQSKAPWSEHPDRIVVTFGESYMFLRSRLPWKAVKDIF